MYEQTIQYKNYLGKLKNGTAYFNLDAREVMGMLPQLMTVFQWLDSNKDEPGDEPRSLTTQEVSEFYTDLEELLLQGWGEMSEDGELFRKSGKYDFQESALFNGVMMHFLFKPEEGIKLLEGMLPTEFFEQLKAMNPEQMAAAVEGRADDKGEIARLKAELAAAKTTPAPVPAPTQIVTTQ